MWDVAELYLQPVGNLRSRALQPQGGASRNEGVQVSRAPGDQGSTALFTGNYCTSQHFLGEAR